MLARGSYKSSAPGFPVVVFTSVETLPEARKAALGGAVGMEGLMGHRSEARCDKMSLLEEESRLGLRKACTAGLRSRRIQY